MIKPPIGSSSGDGLTAEEVANLIETTSPVTSVESYTGNVLLGPDDVEAQPRNTNLDALAALDSSTGLIEQTGAATFVRRAIGVSTASSIPTRSDADTRYQAADSELSALAGLTSAADKLPYFTGSGTAALSTLTSAGRNLIDDADTKTQRATLGVPAIYTGKTTAPTATDDSDDGYVAGDIWNDTTNNMTYIADSVSVGAADWRSLLAPDGVIAFLEGGAWYAQAVMSVMENKGSIGTLRRIGSPVLMTQEGTSYSPILSGNSISFTAAGIGTGNTGAIQSNSMRWAVALSSLGITITSSSTRWVRCQCMADSITDNGEVRAGTLDLISWLGVGSTTALVGVSTYRPISGVNYGGGYFQTSATTINSMATNANTRGAFLSHSFPSHSGTVHYGVLGSTGNYLGGSGSASGTVISGSNPTYLVVAARGPSGASGGSWSNPRFCWLFGPDVGSGAL